MNVLTDLRFNLSNLSFQIDFVHSEILSNPDFFTWIRKNCDCTEKALEDNPKIIRWNFNNFNDAIHTIVLADLNTKHLSKRLICEDFNMLFLQEGPVEW